MFTLTIDVLEVKQEGKVIIVKNRKGSTLAMALLVFAGLMIVGTSILSFMVTENKQSLNHQYKTQAYYIARSGAVATEKVIETMNQDEKKLGDFLKNFDHPTQTLKADISGLEFNNGLLKPVLISYQDNIIKITATGIVNNVRQKVTREIVIEKSSSKMSVALDKVLSALGNMTIEGGTINGDFGANQSIKIDGWPTIKGDAYIKDESNFTKTNSGMAPNLNVMGGALETQYINPVLPDAPINNSSSDTNFEISGGPTNPAATISTSRSFNKMTINHNRELILDTSHGDIQLIVNNFNMTQGQIKIEGDGKVEIIILDKFYLQGSLNESGNPDQLDLFYYGDETFIWSNNGSSIAGSLYVKQADIQLESGYWIGAIISGGDHVTIKNAGPKYKVAIYAPFAELNIDGGILRGAFLGKNITIPNQGAHISYDAKYAENMGIPVGGTDISDSVTIKKRYFKNE